MNNEHELEEGPMMMTILAVEDNPNDLLFLERALDRAGIRCNLISARNGVEAQDVLKTMEQSAATQELVIFSDVNMPRQNGLEFLRWLKGEPHFNRLPVVMLSSFDGSRDMNRAFEFGAWACMTKPPDPNAVKGLLATVQGMVRPGNEPEKAARSDDATAWAGVRPKLEMGAPAGFQI